MWYLVLISGLGPFFSATHTNVFQWYYCELHSPFKWNIQQLGWVRGLFFGRCEENIRMSTNRSKSEDWVSSFRKTGSHHSLVVLLPAQQFRVVVDGQNDQLKLQKSRKVQVASMKFIPPRFLCLQLVAVQDDGCVQATISDPLTGTSQRRFFTPMETSTVFETSHFFLSILVQLLSVESYEKVTIFSNWIHSRWFTHGLFASHDWQKLILSLHAAALQFLPSG